MSAETLVRIGDLLTVALIFAYGVCALLFAFGGLWAKAIYFAGAAVLTVGIWRMT